ncbi:MAG: hypothetical protein IT431_10515 [Phycisphaerales bacterium]|nr:hypothetical protein [Phycisphaerales bacterium]
MSNTRPNPPTAFLLVLGAALALPAGCGKRTRAEEPAGFSVGLETLLGEDPAPADILVGAETPDEPEPGYEGAMPETDLQSLIDAQAADLAAALGTEPIPAETGPEQISAETEASVSLEDLVPGDESGLVTEAPAGEAGAGPDPLDLEDLYAKLHDALGRELGETSEPFRMAVAMVSLAAAQGKDPSTAVGAGTVAGDRLSPAERESALAIAGLLGSLLGPEGSDAGERAAILREFGEQLSSTVGLQLPKAILCTRVRGFGKYEAFSSTSFLAGRPIRALVYVEVDRFEHGQVDRDSLGGLEVEEEWSIDLSQTLELYHEGEKAILAWKRPEEVVVETSRNKQRDFYLLTEITLPQTLTVGSYQLKVVVKDRVGEQQAEAFIPIKVVADPALAWTPE